MAVATPGRLARSGSTSRRADRGGPPRGRGRRARERRAAPGRHERAAATGELGEFDYVIAHGVYAWVPRAGARRAARREPLPPRRGRPRVRLLQRPPRRLPAPGAARGGAVVRARRAGARPRRAERAQELYRYLRSSAPASGDPWGGMLAKTLPPLASGPVYRLVHDDLSEFWEPVWFADFVAHAAAAPARLRRRRATSATCSRRALPGDVEREPARAGGGRPDRARAGHRHAALQLLPPVGAVPGQPHGDARPDAGRDARRCRFAARAGGGAAPERAAAPRRSSCCARARRRRSRFGELRAALGAEAEPLAEALLEGFRTELVMPHAAPLRGRLGGGRGAAGGQPARPLAGGARARGHEPRLHERAHGGAGRAAC